MAARALLVFSAGLVVFTNIFKIADAIAINNGVVGTPSISCDEETISLIFETQSMFRGRVYVKGRVNDPECYQAFPTNSQQQVTYTIQLGSCGMQRFRMMQPAGMSMKIIIVVSFHPIFVTKVDRGYSLECSFQGAKHTVSQSVDVSMVGTTPLFGGGTTVDCTYSIRQGSQDGQTLRFATLGEKAVHVWDCTGNSIEMYGMLVHNCVASDDGSVNVVPTLDDRGCSLDPVLLEDVTYENNRLRAYARTHIYKYSDRTTIFFRCDIKLCSRNTGECDNVTPPRCAGAASLRLLKRSVIAETVDNGEMTLATDRIMVLDSAPEVESAARLYASHVLPTPHNKNNHSTTSTTAADSNKALPKRLNENRSNSAQKPTENAYHSSKNSYKTVETGVGSIRPNWHDFEPLGPFSQTPIMPIHSPYYGHEKVCLSSTVYALMACVTLTAIILCSLLFIAIFVKYVCSMWSDFDLPAYWSQQQWAAWPQWSYPPQSCPFPGEIPAKFKRTKV